MFKLMTEVYLTGGVWGCHVTVDNCIVWQDTFESRLTAEAMALEETMRVVNQLQSPRRNGTEMNLTSRESNQARRPTAVL